MAKRHYSLSFAVITLGGLIAVGSVAATTNNLETNLSEARWLIRKFDETQSASLLKESASKLLSCSLDQGLMGNKSAKRSAMLTWIELFFDIDTAENRLAGPAPSLNVAPPDDSVAAGTDPAAVKDPKVRAEYERLIKANYVRAEKRRAFDSMKKIDDLAESYFAAYVKQAYGTIGEKANLSIVIANSNLLASRKDALTKLILN